MTRDRAVLRSLTSGRRTLPFTWSAWGGPLFALFAMATGAGCSAASGTLPMKEIPQLEKLSPFPCPPERSAPQPYASLAKKFGAIPGDSIPDTQALQNAINEAIATHEPLILPPGDYIIDDTLFIGSMPATTVSSYVSFVMRGSSGSFVDRSGATGATIRMKSQPGGPLLTDRPALSIQGGYDVTIADLQVIGENAVPGHSAANWDPPQYVSPNVDDWIGKIADGGVPSDAGTPFSKARYAPYAGIVVDGYSGVSPAAKDGGVAYPTHDGSVPYGQTPGTRTRFENVFVSNFVVGIALKPSDDDNNAESITFERVVLSDNTYGLSVGGSQERCVVLQNSSISSSHTMITTKDFGPKNGQPPLLRNVNLGTSYRAFSFGGDVGTISIDGLHLESTAMLGDFGVGGTSAYSNAHIANANIGFYSFVKFKPPFLFQTWVPITFSNVSFGLFGSGAYATRPFTYYAGNNCQPAGCGVRFENSTFSDAQLGGDGKYRVIMPQSGREQSVASANIAVSYAAPVQELNDEGRYATIPARLYLAPNVRRIEEWTTALAYSVNPLPVRVPVTLVYNAAHPRNSATTLVADFPASTPTTLFVGDSVYWQAIVPGVTGYVAQIPVLKVTSVRGTRVTMAKTVSGLDPAYFATSTALSITVDVLRPAFVNKTPATFTWSANGKTLTLVSGPITNFQVGDFIQATGLAANTRVSAVGGATLSINRPATLAMSNTAVVNTALVGTPW